MKLAVVDPDRIMRASSLETARRCLASSVLPAASTWSEAAERGTQVHAELETDGFVAIRSALATHPEIPKCDPASFRAEVELGCDPANGAAWEPKTRVSDTRMIYGRCDGYALTADGTAIVVWDYKTGQEVSPPAENYQLRFYACALAALHERDEAWVVIVYLDSADDPEPVVRAAHLDLVDLLSFRAELTVLVADRAKAMAEKSADHHVGPWCGYCGSLPWCEAQANLIRSAVQSGPPAPDKEMTQDEAMAAYGLLSVLKKTMERTWEALEHYAEARPMVLPSGKTFGPTEWRREFLDGPTAVSVVAKLYGEEAAMVVGRTIVAKSDLERVLDKPDVEAAMRAIRDAGGVRVKRGTHVREHR